MERSAELNELAAALAKAQGAMSTVEKGNTARIPTKAGAEYTYTYADLCDVLAMVRKPLADNGLCILQAPTVTERSVEVETMLLHVSGQYTACRIAMALDTHDPKAVGSGITYGRRYGLCLVGAVTGDDDDAGAASKPPPARKAQPAQPQAPRPAVQPLAGGLHAEARAEADRAFDELDGETPPPPDQAPASRGQKAAIHILAAELFTTPERIAEYRAWMKSTWGVESSKDMTEAQAQELIERLRVGEKKHVA